MIFDGFIIEQEEGKLTHQLGIREGMWERDKLREFG